MAFKNGWAQHPAVRTGVELAIGERAADVMKRTLATWTCLLGFGALLGRASCRERVSTIV